MSAGTIGKWLKSEGDKINPGDSMAEIETDKVYIYYLSAFLIEQIIHMFYPGFDGI